MMFKGVVKGVEFVLNGRKVITEDPILKRELEMGISLGAFGRGVNRVSVENMIGQSIVKKFDGEIIHMSDAPPDTTYKINRVN